MNATARSHAGTRSRGGRPAAGPARRRRTFAAALAAGTISLAAPAAARDLVTPPVYVPTGWTITCTVTNIGTKTLQPVEVGLIDADGDVVHVLSSAGIEPGNTQDLHDTPAAGFYHCRGLKLSRNKAVLTACSRPDQISACETQTVNR